MGEFLARLVVYTIIFATAGVVGIFIRNVRNRADMRALPEPTERFRLVRELRARRKQGVTHSDCMQYLRSQGLRQGVAQGLISDVEREQAPYLTSTQTMHWNNCSCQYPKNWRVTTTDEKAGFDQCVSLHGSGSGMILLARENDTLRLQSLTDEYVGQLDRYTSLPVTTWGNLVGKGQRLCGTHKTLKLPMNVVVFRPDSEVLSFVLVEFCAMEEAELIAPAFQLIQSTFKIG